MNKICNKLFTLDPLHKKEKQVNKSIVVAEKPTIGIYRYDTGGWHCDINVHGYVYGAIRHEKSEIEQFADWHIGVQLEKGINLHFINFSIRNGKYEILL